MSAGGWFMVDCKGALSKVDDEDSAKYLAAKNDRDYLRLAPHRAVQLVELTPRLAAAEGVLAALQAIVDLDDGDTPGLWPFSQEFDDARAAIDKATGEQK